MGENMSLKSQCLNYLEDILHEHDALLMSIDVLVRTANPDETKINQDPSDCAYHKWMLSQDKRVITQRVGLQPMEKLEKIHKEWHATYKKIIDIFYPEKKSFLKKIAHLGPSQQELDRAKSYLFDLQTLTKELDNTLTLVKRRVTALSESKFD